jgi:hypothetical protein
VERTRGLALGHHAKYAAIAVNDRVHFASTAGTTPLVEVEVGPVTELVACGDQFWVVAGGQLHRFTEKGKATCAPSPLWGKGRLITNAQGAPAAAWSAPKIAVFSGAEAASIEIPGDPDFVIPVSSNRWVTCTRDRVKLRDAASERWSISAPGSRIIDGAMLFGGRAVALVSLGVSEARLVTVLGLHDGALQQRISLSTVDAIRFAPTRGVAAILSGSRSVTLFDLRFGRVIKEHVAERDIEDVALDDSGQSILFRYTGSESDVQIVNVNELVSAPTAPASTLGDDENEAPAVAVVSSVPDETEERADEPAGVTAFHHALSLGTMALLPQRSRAEPIPPAQVLTLLDSYRGVVQALLGRAIARAWDEGRLSLPNEGPLPFHTEVKGLLGNAANRARGDVESAERQVLAARAALRASEASLGGQVSPLNHLAAEMGLSGIAQLILLIVAAPALWGDLARLFGIVANDENRPLVDEHIIGQLLDGDVQSFDVARELDRDAPLVRHGLIDVGAGKMRPFLSLRCEPVVLRILRGDDAVADVRGIRVVRDIRTFESLLIPADTKRVIAAACATPPAGNEARIVIRGRDGSGRHALLATLADAAGRQIAIIDATAAIRELAVRAAELRDTLLRAHILGHIPVVDGVEALPADSAGARDTLRMILDEHPGPLAIRLPWDGEAPIAAGFVQIDLPALSIEQRAQAWSSILADRSLQIPDPGELAVRYSVGPGVITRASDRVAALVRDRENVTTDAPAPDLVVELEAAIRQHLETKLRATATRVTRLASWDKVVLPPDIQESVLELIARIKHRRTVYDTWGYDRVLTTARGVTALFSGGPGTGKTLVASAIANELGMDLYRVDLSRIMSKWIGETEQNLAKLFDAAEDGHAIILFDEADSLFAKRTEVKSSVDKYANLEVNYLLQRLDTFEGIAILTTNFGTSIDSAFKRRLSFRLTFPFPDEDAREQLWRSHLPPAVPRGGEFDFADLARRYRLSGGYIRNAALRAAFLAAEENGVLTQDHLERAIKAEFREIGKLAESGVLE